MKKIISVLLILLIMCGCAKTEKNISKPLADALAGEVISDGGIAARVGEWIYYVNGDNFMRSQNERFFEYSGALVRMKEDGTQKDVVVDRDVSVFNIEGEYIYVCYYENSKSSVARVRLDGSEFMRLKTFDDIYYGGCYAFTPDCIFFTEDYRLFAMDKDGNNERKVTDFKVYNLRGGEKYSYFTKEENETIGKAYRIENSSGEFTDITESAAYVLATGEKTYYYLIDNAKVYLYNENDFSSSAVIHGGFTEYVFFDGGYAASLDKGENAGIFFIPEGGGQKVKISENSGACMAYLDGYVYYINESKLNYLSRCSLDGKVDEVISEEFVYDFDTLDVLDKCIYFFSDSDEDRVYRYNTETDKIECIEYEDFSIIG